MNKANNLLFKHLSIYIALESSFKSVKC